MNSAPETPRESLRELGELLDRRRADVAAAATVIGFDGFIDQVLRVVEERRGPGRFVPVADIRGFAGWIGSCAGKSGMREVLLDEVAPGGCTMNMGDGMAAAGVPVDCFAVLGEPPAAAFAPWLAKFRTVRALPLDHGHATIFEFGDGKLIFCRLSHFERFDGDFLAAHLPVAEYLAACRAAKAIVITCWSTFPFMNDCWEWLLDRVFAAVSHRPWFYFDLADPASRSGADRRRMIGLLGRFAGCGPAALSLNLSEANHLATTLGLPAADDSRAAVEALAVALRERAAVAEVGIHRVRAATVASAADGVWTVAGPYCRQPKKSTGAGDRFNAGYCLGLELGLAPVPRLLLGTAMSGFYVRHARSASLDELIAFVGRWADGESLMGGEAVFPSQDPIPG